MIFKRAKRFIIFDSLLFPVYRCDSLLLFDPLAACWARCSPCHASSTLWLRMVCCSTSCPRSTHAPRRPYWPPSCLDSSQVSTCYSSERLLSDCKVIVCRDNGDHLRPAAADRHDEYRHPASLHHRGHLRARP